MVNPSEIQFFSQNVRVSLPSRSFLKNFILRQAKKEGKKIKNLNYIFCSDKRLLEINRQYLKHDFYTDIITFEFSDNKKVIAGEIYISIDRVRENARTYSKTIREELLRVIFHGVLHLCGYSDKSVKLKQKMTEKENEWLRSYKSVPRDTI